MVEFVTDESAAISDRFEWDLFTLGEPTCSPACVEDNGVCASEGLRSRDEDVCDEDNGVRASAVLRSRDDTMVVIVKTGWDAVEQVARLDAVLLTLLVLECLSILRMFHLTR